MEWNGCLNLKTFLPGHRVYIFRHAVIQLLISCVWATNVRCVQDAHLRDILRLCEKSGIPLGKQPEAGGFFHERCRVETYRVMGEILGSQGRLYFWSYCFYAAISEQVIQAQSWPDQGPTS